MEIEKIETKTFPVARRGYDRAEVDAYLRAVANDYRMVVDKAREAVSAAQQAAIATTSATAVPSFEDIGGRVAGVLSSASQAAEDIRAEAEQEAAAIRQKAEQERMNAQRAAAEQVAAAQQVKAASEEEAAELTAAARVEASSVIAAAREEAIRIAEDAERSAATLDRTTRANTDALLAEARREYEHLRSVQQQCVDRLASVEFLTRQAREHLAQVAPYAIDDRS
ncbi:MAG: DivIVA domain-containing protein [Actinomycetota bacterium]|nr:DivIVA domain-containing protein [Actinomycetota bacterium]